MATNTVIDVQASPSDRLASRLAQEVGPDYLRYYGITTTATAAQELLIEAVAGYRLQLPTSSAHRIEVLYFGRRLDTDVPAPAAPEFGIFQPTVNAAGVITLGSALAGTTLSVLTAAAATDAVSGKQYVQIRVSPAAAARTYHAVYVTITGLASPPQFMTPGAFSGVRS